MKISLIHPSRGRANKSFINHAEWMLKAKGADVETIVAVDFSDPTYPEYEKLYGASCYVGQHDNVVAATNAAAYRSTGDILIYLSDDFKCPDNWAELVIKEFEGCNEPRLIKVDDKLQPLHARVLTIPIMNRSLYNRLGYFWHPAYKSMWVDCDLYETCYKNGFLKNVPHLTFTHDHHSVGRTENDDTYKRSETNWNQGLEVFNNRKKTGFKI